MSIFSPTVKFQCIIYHNTWFSHIMNIIFIILMFILYRIKLVDVNLILLDLSTYTHMLMFIILVCIVWLVSHTIMMLAMINMKIVIFDRSHKSFSYIYEYDDPSLSHHQRFQKLSSTKYFGDNLTWTCSKKILSISHIKFIQVPCVPLNQHYLGNFLSLTLCAKILSSFSLRWWSL